MFVNQAALAIMKEQDDERQTEQSMTKTKISSDILQKSIFAKVGNLDPRMNKDTLNNSLMGASAPTFAQRIEKLRNFISLEQIVLSQLLQQVPSDEERVND